MSQWTQVSGAIRIDAFVNLGGMTDTKIEREITKRLGRIITYESSIEETEAKDKTPMGSEGGIHYEFVRTATEDSSLCRGVVVVSGSLRDYGEEDYREIQKWLNKAFAESGKRSTDSIWVRQGAVEIEVEGKKKVILVWDDDYDMFIEVPVTRDAVLHDAQEIIDANI